MSSFFRSLFAIDEIENSKRLQIVFWILLIGFALDLLGPSEWIEGVQAHARDSKNMVCWPHFPSCDEYLFLDSIPAGYSAPIFVTVLFGFLMLAVTFALKGRWTPALGMILPVLGWKVFYHFFAHQTHWMNFQLFHIPFVLIFLFARSKWGHLKLALVVLYSLAATVKFTPSWIEGGYFSNLALGLPLVPRDWIPWATNLVILFEVFGSWGLVAPVKLIRRTAFFGWIGFHLYSVILVGLFYPLHCLPLLIALFMDDDKALFDRSVVGRISWWPLALLGGLATLQAVPRLTLPDWRYTGVTYQYGFDMIGANYQCRVGWRAFDKNDTLVDEGSWSSRDAIFRCPPYISWFPLKKMCERDERVHRIYYHHDVSLDGGPFYRIVETQNACTLTYRALSSNDWIRTPEEGAPVTGSASRNPMKNSRRWFGNSEPVVDEEDLSAPEERSVWSLWGERLYWLIWFTVTLLGAVQVFASIRNARTGHR